MKKVIFVIYMTPFVIYRFIHLLCYIIWNLNFPIKFNLKIHFDEMTLPEEDDHLKYQENIFYPKSFFSKPLLNREDINFKDRGNANLGIVSSCQEKNISFYF